MTFLELLLQAQHDPGHLVVQLYQPVLVSRGELDDSSHRGENCPGKYPESDQGVGRDETSYQGAAQHGAANSGGDVAVLLVLHILHLNVVDLFGDVL